MITKEGISPINSLTNLVKTFEEAGHSKNTPPEIASLFGAMATMGSAALQALQEQQRQIEALQTTVKKEIQYQYYGGNPGL